MASVVTPNSTSGPGFKGLSSIFQYRNQDGQKQDTNCGQAAACTMLTYRGKLTRDTTVPNPNMITLETSYPPDNLGGVFGTSRKQVEKILTGYSLNISTVSGKDDLKQSIQNLKPVIVMTSVTFQTLPVFRTPSISVFGVTLPSVSTPKEIPSAHWMVAYAYDDAKVYLTNYGSMTWDEFLGRWDSAIGKAINMQSKGLVATNT
jgi:uncharacterized protein YvpB